MVPCPFLKPRSRHEAMRGCSRGVGEACDDSSVYMCWYKGDDRNLHTAHTKSGEGTVRGGKGGLESCNRVCCYVVRRCLYVRCTVVV
jgi:hypothetical protein